MCDLQKSLVSNGFTMLVPVEYSALTVTAGIFNFVFRKDVRAYVRLCQGKLQIHSCLECKNQSESLDLKTLALGSTWPRLAGWLNAPPLVRFLVKIHLTTFSSRL